jgi:hypothetical protein
VESWQILELITRKLGPTPLHTSIQIQSEWDEICATPPYIDYNEREHDNATSWLLKWNGAHAIPLYNGCSEGIWQCHLFYCLSGMGFVPFHHTLTQVECNYDNATFLTIA